MALQKYFSNPSTNFFPNPSIKLKLGLQVRWRLLIATHLDQSNYLANEGANKYDLTLFIKLLQCSSRALKAVHLFRVPAYFQWIHWIRLMNLIQDFQSKIFSAGSHTERLWRWSKDQLGQSVLSSKFTKPTWACISMCFRQRTRGCMKGCQQAVPKPDEPLVLSRQRCVILVFKSLIRK